MKHTYILYVDTKYNILAAPHRDITFQNTGKLHDFFVPLIRTCFSYCQMQNRCNTHLHIVCLCIETSHFWQNMIWSLGFLKNIFEILLARGCARDRLSFPRVSPFPSVLLPLSFSRPEFLLRRLRATMAFSVSVVPLFYPFFKRGQGERRDRGWHGARPITNVKSISHCRGIGEVRRPRRC